MATYFYADVTGTTISSFDPATDTIQFSVYVDAASLWMKPLAGDTLVGTRYGTSHVTLAGIAPADLDASHFVFPNGSLWVEGSAGADAFEGTALGDQFDVHAGGEDSVNAGAGNDIILIGAGLSPGDRIDGGAGVSDRLVVAASPSDEVLVLDGTLVRGIEVFEFDSGGTVRLKLTQALLGSATPPSWEHVQFLSLSQTAADATYLDASLITSAVEVHAGAGNDTVSGGAGRDSIHGGSGANLLLGHGGGDALSVDGSDGDSTLHGGGGSDTLTGGNGNDVLYAAGWQDLASTASADSATTWNTLTGGNGDDMLFGAEGKDRLSGDAGNDLVEGQSGDDTLIGGLGDDTLRGGAGHDNLAGGAGVDQLEGGAGDDTYELHDADDLIVEAEGDGRDSVTLFVSRYVMGTGLEDGAFDSTLVSGYLEGNAADNRLEGAAGADTLVGGSGNDTLAGAGGVNRLEGGAGDDTYELHNGTDTIVEDADGGVDTVIVAWSNRHVLGANIENGKILGSGGELVGNDGANVLTMQASAQGTTLRGGAGDDTYIVSDAWDAAVIETARGGVDRVIAPRSWVLGAFVEHLTLSGAARNGTGNALDNELLGNRADNLLDGAAGADTLIGGGGDDTYKVDARDTVVESAGGGRDTVVASSSYTLGAHCEELRLEADQAIGARGVGNGLDNVLYGHRGRTTLDGGAGADTMYGGWGSDTYIVDSSRDVVVEARGDYDGLDVVHSSVSFTLGEDLENLVLTGTTAINGWGNSDGNLLRGNAANNRLSGGDGYDTLVGGQGADTLRGGRGADTYHVNSADDVVMEVEETDSWDNAMQDTVNASIHYKLGAHLEQLHLQGSGDLRGTGNGVANKIYGNEGDNRLDGRGGRDTLEGGRGNDTYVVGDEGDVVREEGARGGLDTVEAGLSYILPLGVENLVLTGTRAISGSGNAAANHMVGNAAANRLNGRGGVDTLIGGAGNDTYVVTASDVVVERSGGGVDTIVSDHSRSLAAFEENLTLSGTSARRATGNALANKLVGNGEDNLLDGGRGADTMAGGNGSDTYIVDDKRDVVEETISWSFDQIDVVKASVNYTLSSEVEVLVLTGSARRGTGNDLGNDIAGNDADNVLNGREGNDLLYGGAGHDTLVGGLGDDELQGGSGRDHFTYQDLAEGDVDMGWDLIVDFQRGTDKIDLSPDRFRFQFIGDRDFSASGQLRYEAVDGGLLVLGNIDSDLEPEFVIGLVGLTSIGAGDFIL